MRYRRMTLAGFDAYTATLREKLDAVWQWVRCNSGLGLFLSGPVGVGKTHLAAGALRELARRGFQVAYAHALLFTAAVQAGSKQGQEPADTICALLRDGLDLLVLDDLGVELTDSTGVTYLGAIVELCYARAITVIATSTLPLEQVYELAPALGSRLAEMCDVLAFSGEGDYRLVVAERRKQEHASSALVN
jgi:DNA replication protein DnaC